MSTNPQSHTCGGAGCSCLMQKVLNEPLWEKWSGVHIRLANRVCWFRALSLLICSRRPSNVIFLLTNFFIYLFFLPWTLTCCINPETASSLFCGLYSAIQESRQLHVVFIFLCFFAVSDKQFSAELKSAWGFSLLSGEDYVRGSCSRQDGSVTARHTLSGQRRDVKNH